MLGVILLVFSTSAPLWALPEAGVGYKRAADEECTMCFAETDCFKLNSARCEYYMETTKILHPHKYSLTLPPHDKRKYAHFSAEVDALIFSVVENALIDRVSDECIPFVSKYTNCNKENVCLGCKTCECNELAQWNCTITHECRPELLKLVADHETIQTVIATLNGDLGTTRNKRSLHKWHLRDDSFEDKVNHAKLAEWIHSEPTLDFDDDAEEVVDKHKYLQHKKPRKTKHRRIPNDKLVKSIIDSLIHDTLPEVLKEARYDYENNRVKRWIKTKNKADPNETTTTVSETSKMAEVTENSTKITFDELYEWLNIVHPKVYLNSSTDIKVNQLKQLEEWKAAVNSVPSNATEKTNADYIAFEEVLSNIASDNKTYSNRDRPELEDKHIDEINMDDSKYYLEDERENYNDKDIEEKISDDIPNYEGYEFSPKTLQAVKDFLDNNKNMNNDTDDIDSNKIDKVDPVSIIMKREISNFDNVVTTEINPVTNNTQTSSLEDLKDDVLGPLDKILKDKQNEIQELLKIRESLRNFLKSHKHKNMSRESFLSIYQLEVLPHHHHHDIARRTNSTFLDKYLLKLKRDIYEVIRDIISIRKLFADPSAVPPELTYLIRVLKNYIHKTGFRIRKGNVQHTRRNEAHNNNDIVKNCMKQLLELLDKDMPKSDVLAYVSPYAARITRRLLKNNYVDKFAGSGLRVYDSNYNLTDDLRNVGTQWLLATATIQHSPLHDILHNMKRLHLILSVDIAKLNDALALIEFARSRRMVPVDESDGQRIVDNINKNLEEIKKRFNEFITTSRKAEKANDVTEHIDIHKKKSFLGQIKKLLHNSRKDIAKLFKRKVPKADIVKEIARKHVQEITRRKLEETMRNWQTKLNIISDHNNREKRSPNFNGLSRRIKNIIPKYLRGKVHPALTKNIKSGRKGNVTNVNNAYKKKNIYPLKASTGSYFTSKANKLTSISPKTANSTVHDHGTANISLQSSAKSSNYVLPSSARTT